MSEYLIQGDTLSAIADAIRAKTGKSDAMTPQQMPGEIEGISGGNAEPTIYTTMRFIEPPENLYYFNREQYGEIPAEILEEYPYPLILRYGLDGSTNYLLCSKEKAYVVVDEEGVIRLYVPKYAIYLYNSTTKTWLRRNAGVGPVFYKINGSLSYCVWWSDYDVPLGSSDSEEIYFPASPWSVEMQADATHFYYNGVRLPKIPEELLVEYPYVFIRKGATRYDVVFSTTKYWYQESDGTGRNSDGTVKNYWLTFEDMVAGLTWSHRNDSRYYWEDFATEYLWSNYDVPNGSATSTTIYKYGTLAVPDPL